MSTNEERAPLGAVPDDPAPQTREAPVEGASEQEHGSARNEAAHAHDALSPAVRRLVRQFDLDITTIHGTGPAGRIRVGDVMGLLSGRTDSGKRDAPARPAASADDDDGAEPESAPAAPLPGAPRVPAALPTTTVFDCDLSRVLSHRKRLRQGDVELLTTSYVLTALAAALDATPDITAGHAARFGVSLTTTDGEQRSAFVDTAAVSWDAALDERVRAVDAALRAKLDADTAAANLLVHHYGESGSLLATPTPIGAGHAASVGIGRVRREIVVRTVDGAEAPRVAALCYLTLSFHAALVPLHRANGFMRSVVQLLEEWPE